MTELSVEELVNTLIETEGITEAHVSVTIKPVVRKVNTGETDRHFNPIRERAVSEDEMSEIVEDSEWQYYGTIDTMGDFYLKDRFSKRHNVESDMENE